MGKKPVAAVLLPGALLCLALPCMCGARENTSGRTLREGSYLVPMHTNLDLLETDQCILTVKDKEMKALFVSGPSCAAISYGDQIPDEKVPGPGICYPVKNASGDNAFSIPVEFLDQKNGIFVLGDPDGTWHPGYVTIFSEEIPEEAFLDGSLVTAADLGLKDGTYMSDVTLEGGTGKASVGSPAVLEVKDGTILAEIVWSSPNYDYMIVGDERYEKQNTDGNSMFRIPVDGFDADLPVIGDTTAMSRPHEIEYTLRFDSGTVCPFPENLP